MSDGEGEGESERKLLMFDVVFAEKIRDALRYVVKELCVVCVCVETEDNEKHKHMTPMVVLKEC